MSDYRYFNDNDAIQSFIKTQVLDSMRTRINDMEDDINKSLYSSYTDIDVEDMRLKLQDLETYFQKKGI